MGRPYTLELSPGERKALCTCQQTKKGPFCDGSHKGSSCTPIIVHFIDQNKVTVSGTSCQDSHQGSQNASHQGCCRQKAPASPSGCCRDVPMPSKLEQVDAPKAKGHHGHGGCCQH